MQVRTWMRGRNVGLIILIVVLLITAVWAIVKFIPIPTTTSPTSDLAVCGGDVVLPDRAMVNSNEFVKNSLPSSSLKWSDSVSTPFVATTPETMLDEVMQENGGNPTLLLMQVEALSEIVISENGTTIGDVNPCFGEFIELAKQGGGMAGGFIVNGTSVVDDVTFTAQRVNTLLLRLNLSGISTEQSVENWHIPPISGMSAGTLPVAVKNSVQEDLPVLALEYTLKGQDCPAFRVGFNTGDKRFERLPAGCSPTPPTSTTPPTCPPETPYGEWPVCKDSPSNDPAAQGNNRPGGNGVAPVQTDPVGDPAGGDPPATYTPSPSPSPSGPPKGSTADPTPAPSPQPSSPPSSDPVSPDEGAGCAPGIASC